MRLLERVLKRQPSIEWECEACGEWTEDDGASRGLSIFLGPAQVCDKCNLLDDDTLKDQLDLQDRVRRQEEREDAAAEGRDLDAEERAEEEAEERQAHEVRELRVIADGQGLTLAEGPVGFGFAVLNGRGLHADLRWRDGRWVHGPEETELEVLAGGLPGFGGGSLQGDQPLSLIEARSYLAAVKR